MELGPVRQRGIPQVSPEFQASTLRCLVAVAAQLGDRVQIQTHTPRDLDWWVRVKGTLVREGYRQYSKDRALFLLKQGTARVQVLVHPEACVISSNNDPLAHHILTLLSLHLYLGWRQKDLPFHGLHLEQVQDGSLRLHQQSVITQVLAAANLPQPDWEAVLTRLQSLAQCTRPDLVNAVDEILGTDGAEREALLWDVLQKLHDTAGVSPCY